MTEQSLMIWARRLAPGLALLATCVGYLAGRGYPLTRPETFLILAGALLIGALFGLLCELLPQWAVALLLGFLVILFASITFSVSDILANLLADHFGGTRGETLSRAIGLLVIFVLPLAGALVLRRTLPTIMTAGMSVFIAAAVIHPATPRPVPTWINSNTSGERPGRLVLHLILDEFVGNEGLGDDFPNAAELRADITRFFLSRGFSLYEGTFSSYKATRESIPALLNFSRPTPDQSRPLVGPQPFAWFEKLHDAGYRVEYIGIATLPLCEGANAALVANCALFSLNASDNAHGQPKGTLGEAAEIVHKAFVENDIFQHVSNALGIPLPVASWDAGAQLDLVQNVLEHEGGDLGLISHILLPHYPFFYDANCLRSLSNARQALASREDYDRAYSGQLRCALKRLDQLIEVVDRRWPGAQIIVQSDHGLRQLLQFARPGDVRLNFAALFATRDADMVPRVISRQENLQGLFAFYAGGVHLPDSRVVYLDSTGRHIATFPR